MIQEIFSWFGANWIEVIGALAGFVYVFLEIKQNTWLWPVGLLTSAFYIVVFFTSKFYADMALQFYYLGISIYGWLYWMRGGWFNFGKGKKEAPKPDHSLPIKHVSWSLSGVLLLVSALLMVLLAQILIHFTDSPLPWGDAFTTALSIVATWMLARKLLEQWIIWIIVDLVSAVLYFYKGLHVTSMLFFFYTIICIVGYLEWKRTMKKEMNPALVDAF